MSLRRGHGKNRKDAQSNKLPLLTPSKVMTALRNMSSAACETPTRQQGGEIQQGESTHSIRRDVGVRPAEDRHEERDE